MCSPFSLTRTVSSAVLPSEPGAPFGHRETGVFSARAEPTRNSRRKKPMRQVPYPNRFVVCTFALSPVPATIRTFFSGRNCFLAYGLTTRPQGHVARGTQVRDRIAAGMKLHRSHTCEIQLG